jgi:hypothetical protein
LLQYWGEFDQCSQSYHRSPFADMGIFFLRSWYMTFVMMAAEMRLGIDFPVGDLSHFWPRTDVTLGEAEKQA